jgi:hypothetical protein
VRVAVKRQVVMVAIGVVKPLVAVVDMEVLGDGALW